MTKPLRLVERKSAISGQMLGCLLSAAGVAGMIGCQWIDGKVERSSKVPVNNLMSDTAMLAIEKPILDCEVPAIPPQPTPTTLRDFESLQPMPLTLEDAIRMSLSRSQVLQKLGGQVVAAPAAVSTVYDPAIAASDPRFSSEAALSAFDAQFAASALFNHSERRFNNLFFGGGAASLISNDAPFRLELSKRTAAGTTFSLRNNTDYASNNAPANLFPGAWDTVTIAEVRQPLLAGGGVAVNRIAGPGATIGNYNGVLINRIREDISLADFETQVRNLVRDVELTYWQLYFTYQDLDTKLIAQESARDTWENRKKRLDSGLGRPDEEAQARQQYFTFRSQVQNAIVGTGTSGSGLYNTERQLRRLMDLPVNDGTLIRPVTPPTLAPITFDWDQSQALALQNRVEIRRQRWALRQRELELVAAKNLSQWRLDLIANYGNRGFGDNLIGERGAIKDQLAGDLDDYQLGMELAGPLGRRAGLIGVKNAELNQARERIRLEEQQKQIINDLANAYSEVDRAFAQIRVAVNSRIAIQEELEPKRKRVEIGTDDVFFLLEVQQRAATAESNVHRAITDYNIALMNYAFESGALLSNYNVSLQESGAPDGLINAALLKSTYFEPDDNTRPTIVPVSSGAVQRTPGPLGVVTGFPSDPNTTSTGSVGNNSSAPAEAGKSNGNASGASSRKADAADEKEVDDLQKRLKDLLDDN